LGRSVNINFASGASDSFTAQGNPTYNSNGASFTISRSGDSPQLTSKWYIMFGKVEITMRAAPGAGIVSSCVLQSDDLDEIDWEWLGAQDNQVQSNFFGKGQTTTYNRGAVHAVTGTQDGFHTYTIDWTANQIVWQIDGTTVRVLQPNAANGQYPQTPMQLKIGAWSGGDYSNQPGTIAWAQGPTDYSRGPYTMLVRSVAVSDYSTGTQYTYSGTSGTWQSIVAAGGTVNSGGSSNTGSAAPAITSTASGNIIPFAGGHKDSSSTYTTPNVYPWVPQSTTLATSAVATNYPGLPSGWTVTSSGKVVPPSSAASPLAPTVFTSWSPVLLPASSLASGPEVVTSYDQRGFPTLVTVVPGASTLPKSWDSRGFLITVAATAPVAPTTPVGVVTTIAGAQAVVTTPILQASATAAAAQLTASGGLGAGCIVLGLALLLRA
ncbi:transglycosylase, partial [Cryomyces antarcticus]